MDNDLFEREWSRNPEEMTLDGHSVAACGIGAEMLLVDSLRSTNSDLFAITESLNITGTRLSVFAQLTRELLTARINELASVCDPDFPDIFIESCATAADSLLDDLAAISCGRFDERYEWQRLLKKIADDFGGTDAALSVIALCGVTLGARLMKARRYELAWAAASASRKVASLIFSRPSPVKVARTKQAIKAANAKHDGPSGKRDGKAKIREIWASGKYSSRDICAEEECAILELSFSTARKALRGTPDPT